MTDPSKEENAPEEILEEEGVQEPTHEEEAPPEEEEDALPEELQEEEPELSKEEELEIEAAKWKDQAIRTAAELENYRKRVARDLGEARKFGNKDLLREILPVLDNFKMGLDAAAADESSMIFQGMKMVKGQLDEFLTNNGVKTHDPEGEKFDHNLHEAISQEETEDHEEGTILKTVRVGYTLHDQLLRPANVVVAAAPGAEEESSEDTEDATEEE